MSRKRKSDQPTSAAPTKRVRRGRKTRGALEGIPEMPLDILYLIFSYLSPIDLLTLARTTKEFRQFLMRRSSSTLWKTARGNIQDLPDCPSHLSEPAYANLAFFTHCHSCGKANVKTVFWALGVRYCPGCRKSHVVKCSKRLRYCSAATDTDLVAPVSEDVSGSHHWHRSDELPYETQQRFDTLNEPGKEAHKLRVKNIMQWARQCEVWTQNQASNRENELGDLRSSRLQSIVAKLREMNWDDELDRMQPDYFRIRNHPLVNQPRALTDRIWSNIRADMVAYMESIRQRRLNAERQELWTQRCSTFQKVYRGWHAKQRDKRTLPRAADLMRRPDVAKLITADSGEQITQARFEALIPMFPWWAAEWKAECDEKLRALVRRSPALRGRLPAGVDPLSLASVVFTCTKCKDTPNTSNHVRMVPLYPAILAHDCLYAEVWEFDIQDPLERAIASVSQTKSTFGKYTFWSCDRLEVGVWSDHACEVIRACGRNPITATRDEMDAVEDVRLYCYGCPLDSVYHRDIMTWRHALRHYATHDAEKSVATITVNSEVTWTGKHRPSWAIVTDEDTLHLVREKEEEFNALLADQHEQFFFGPWYDCTHCHRGGLSPLALFEHSEWTHSKDEPRDFDFYRTPDAEMCLLRPTMLLHPSFREVMTEETRQKIEDGRATWYDFTLSAPGPPAAHYNISF